MLTLDGILQPTPQIAGFGAHRVRQAITFANTSGTVSVFTVTGDVIVKVIAVCSTDCESGGACDIELGVVGTVAALIVSTDLTLLEDGDIWHDVTPDSDNELLAVAAKHIITDGADIIITLSATADSGAIEFYCLCTPLSTDGLVVAA